MLFNRLLIMLPRVQRSFELRRVLFGLTAVVDSYANVPEMISSRMPDIVQYIVQACVKREEERV
jgi:hypothetical protein